MCSAAIALWLPRCVPIRSVARPSASEATPCSLVALIRVPQDCLIDARVHAGLTGTGGEMSAAVDPELLDARLPSDVQRAIGCRSLRRIGSFVAQHSE